MPLQNASDYVQSANRAPGSIPAWRFDVARLSKKKRIEAWHLACAGFYDLTVDVDVVSEAEASFSWYRLDGLMFSSGMSFPHIARRNRSHVRQQKNFVRILFANRGGSRILIGDHCATLDAGAIHLIDYSRPYVHLRSHSIDLNGVYVPHAAIGYDPSRHPPYIRIGMETPVGQVLSGAFFALASQLPRIEMRAAPALATGLSDLVRALVLRDPESERGLAVVRSARREAMRAFIERHLHDPTLGLESLCRNFGASRATIYRDFKAEGGVDNYVMSCRLERALADLVDAPPSRGAVTAISESWCFESLSHFSRRFHEKFGLAPRDVAGLSAQESAAATDTARSLGRTLPGRAKRAGLSSWFALET